MFDRVIIDGFHPSLRVTYAGIIQILAVVVLVTNLGDITCKAAQDICCDTVGACVTYRLV